MHSIPTLIIGGGTAGASVACALAELGAGVGVTIVDVDLFGRLGSSASSAGGVNCLFADSLDVRLAVESIAFFRSLASKIDYHEQGSLWLCGPETLGRARQWVETARPLGVEADVLAPAATRERFPLLDDLSDVAGAVLTHAGGFVSPHRLRIHYLNRAQAGGVELMDHWQVVRIEGNAPPYRVTLRQVGPRSVKRALTDGAEKGDELPIAAERIINAAGPWSSRIAEIYGRRLPIAPESRQMFLVAAKPGVDLRPLPVFIDAPQDIAFRYGEFDRKPALLVTGSSSAGRIDYAQQTYQSAVEPKLIKRAPNMAGADVYRAWVAYDDYSADRRAIVGPVPGLPGLFNFNGLSARQTSTAPAMARAMAERLITGRWPDGLNLDELSEARFAQAPSTASV
ncbi:MAG TPA: FAD-dependent oxidoreductase [Tepidisphaeraceae bacterium]|jgi:glycine/D-amino acid oxidase-like deaminating enzyme